MSALDDILRGGNLTRLIEVDSSELWKRELEFCKRLLEGEVMEDKAPPSISQYLMTQAAGAKHDGCKRIADILEQCATYVASGDCERALAVFPGAMLDWTMPRIPFAHELKEST